MKFVIIGYFLLANIIAFALMGIDKRKAKKHAWRIPERTLFVSAIIGGSIGAMYGMHVFRHKTQHKSFIIGMPCIFGIQLLLVALWLLL